MSGFSNYLATHRKAIVSGALGALGAVIASISAGSAWQVIVVAGVAGALGVGITTGAVPNRKPAA